MGIHPQTKHARWCYLNKDRSITDQALIVCMYVQREGGEKEGKNK